MTAIVRANAETFKGFAPSTVYGWLEDGLFSARSKVPHDLFVAQHGDSGKAFLDRLGIRRIPAAQVTLHPFLLGQKYQRAAERAILKKHGVIGQRKTEEKK